VTVRFLPRFGGIASTRAISAECSGWRSAQYWKNEWIAPRRHVARAPGVVALVLEMFEERADCGRVELGERKL